MTERISDKDWRLLIFLADDYSALCNIPFEYFQELLPGINFGDEIPVAIRKKAVKSMTEIYKRLYHAGLIDVFILDELREHPKKLSKTEALNELQNEANYDYEHINWPMVTVVLSDLGSELLNQGRPPLL
jgi:hypothetical protein